MADAVTTTPNDTGAPAAPENTQAPAAEPTTDSATDNQTVDTLTPEAPADNAEAETKAPEAPADNAEDTDTKDSAGTPEDTRDGDAEDSAEDDPTDDLDPDADKRLAKVRREAKNLRVRLQDSQAETKAANLRADRLEVAMAAGIPADAVEFLQGDSREALESSAEKLLVMMGYSDRVTPPGVPVEQGGNPLRGKFTSAGEARSNADLDTIGARIYQH